MERGRFCRAGLAKAKGEYAKALATLKAAFPNMVCCDAFESGGCGGKEHSRKRRTSSRVVSQVRSGQVQGGRTEGSTGGAPGASGRQHLSLRGRARC